MSLLTPATRSIFTSEDNGGSGGEGAGSAELATTRWLDIDVSAASLVGNNTVPKRKVLVTGGAGFIASHVAKDCRDLGHEVVIVDDLSGGFMENIPSEVRFIEGDLKNASFVSSLMEEERFDVVYHLAAYAAEGLSHFIRNYNYQNNLVASTNLITQSVRVGTVRRFVFTSSIAVYGSGRTPMTEDMEPRPEDPYGISKYAVELDLKAAHEMFGLEYVIFRPHNVYGPGQNMYDRYRNVIGIFMNQLQSGKSLTVFGDGSQTRKFSYISDVSFPIALAGTHPEVAQEVFNVGGDIATTVNELAQATKEAWGNPEAEVLHLDARNEVAHAESSHQKLNVYFPDLARPVGLRDGLQRMVRWAKASGKNFPPVEFEAVEVKQNMPQSWLNENMKEVPALVHTAADSVKLPYPSLHYAGSDYGGWRYFSEDLPSKGAVIYSFGLGRDLTWEEAILPEHDCDVWGFDSTPISLKYWESIRDQDKWLRFHHQEYLIGATDGMVSLGLPVSHGISYAFEAFNEFGFKENTMIELEAKSLPTFMQDLGHARVDIVKLDVEGAEFDVFDAWSTYIPSPWVCQVLVEWHERLVPDGEARKAKAVSSMETAGFSHYEISLNEANPDGQSIFRNEDFCDQSVLSLQKPITNWHDSTSNPDVEKPKTLVSVHTSMSAWNMTQMMLVSLAATHDEFDIILVDDHSDLDIPSIAGKWGVKALHWGNRTNGPQGLTNSWNLAWQYALQNQYSNLIISNNDLLVPDGTINLLTEALETNEWGILIPTVSKRGSDYPFHTLADQYSDVASWTDQPLNFQHVADTVCPRHSSSKIIERDGGKWSLTNRKILNGYMMAMRVDKLIPHQYSEEEDLLFDPQYINIGNEDDLYHRLGSKVKLGVHGNAFVFHFKGYTLTSGTWGDNGLADDRDSLSQDIGGSRYKESFGSS
jgi:UDP-glucose 4-epimerase